MNAYVEPMTRGPKLNVPPDLPRPGVRGKQNIVHAVAPDPMQRGEAQMVAKNADLKKRHKWG